MKNNVFFVYLALLFLVGVSGCKQDPPVLNNNSIPTDQLSGKYEVAWMNVIREVVRVQAIKPPLASRIYGYAGVTYYESIRGGMTNHVSFSLQLNELDSVPDALPYFTYDFPAAGNEAMYTLVKGLVPDLNTRSVFLLDSMYNSTLNERKADINDVFIINDSRALGSKVAQHILDWAASDNYTETRSMVYTIPSRTGHPERWEPTTAGASPIEPFWGRLRPFALPTSDACHIDNVVPFSTATNSTFYQQALEIANFVTNGTTEQKAIATFWSDDPVLTSTPPGHWVSIAGQVSTQQNLNLTKTAEAYALLNIALADAFISCWDLKFRANLLRPVTYIRENINPNWSPLLSTPMFPEYPSGHSVASGAAYKVLANLLGDVTFTDNTNNYRGLAPRTYTSFQAAATEAAESRLYGGIHYREACESGVKQGENVANKMLDKIQLTY